MEEIVLILFVLGLMVLFFLLGATIGGVARGLKMTIFGVKDSDKFCGDSKSEAKEASIDAAALAAGGVASAVVTNEVVNVTHDDVVENTHQEWSEEAEAAVEAIDSTTEVTRDTNEDLSEQDENEDLSVATPLEGQDLEGDNLDDVDVSRDDAVETEPEPQEVSSNADEVDTTQLVEEPSEQEEASEPTEEIAQEEVAETQSLETPTETTVNSSEMREVRPNAYAVDAKPFSEDQANLRESRPNAYVVDTIPQGEEPLEQEGPSAQEEISEPKDEITQEEVAEVQSLETPTETTVETSEMREVRPNAYAVEAKPFSDDKAHLRESRPNAYILDSTPQGDEPEKSTDYDLKDMAAAAVSTVAGVAALSSTETQEDKSAEEDKSDVQVWDYTQQEVDYSDINFTAEGADDNLQLIKGIDAEMESALKEIGIRQFNQIASLTEKEVNYLRETFNFHSTLNEQVWIEQAKILSAGEITNFSKSSPDDTSVEQEVSETEIVEEETASQETDSETSGADEASLAGLAAAGLAGAVVKEVSEHEGERDDNAENETNFEREPREEREPRGEREPRENKRLFGEKERAERDEEWRNRYHGERKIKRQESAVAAFTSDEDNSSELKKNKTEESLTVEQTEVVEEVQNTESLTQAPQDVEEPAAYVRPVDSDDLSQIKYISTGLEKKLNLLGVYKLSQIANWDEQAIAQISDQLELRGDKILEENWQGLAQEALDKQQAEGTSEFQSSTFSASDLVARLAELDKITDLNEHEKTVLSDNGITELSQIANWSGADVKWAADLLELSSTDRAQGWVTAASALISSGQINIPGGEASGGADDLKRIRGIDDEAASALSSLGVTTYAQIAEWQQSDMDRVNEMLGTSGRVERQYWVVQAKVLKDGGQTDFSKLYDES